MVKMILGLPNAIFLEFLRLLMECTRRQLMATNYLQAVLAAAKRNKLGHKHLY